jgi:hypothetical protein
MKSGGIQYLDGCKVSLEAVYCRFEAEYDRVGREAGQGLAVSGPPPAQSALIFAGHLEPKPQHRSLDWQNIRLRTCKRDSFQSRSSSTSPEPNPNIGFS